MWTFHSSANGGLIHQVSASMLPDTYTEADEEENEKENEESEL